MAVCSMLILLPLFSILSTRKLYYTIYSILSSNSIGVNTLECLKNAVLFKFKSVFGMTILSRFCHIIV